MVLEDVAASTRARLFRRSFPLRAGPAGKPGICMVAAYGTTKVVLGQPRTVLVTYNENLFVARCLIGWA
jgi:hypothetical protein